VSIANKLLSSLVSHFSTLMWAQCGKEGISTISVDQEVGSVAYCDWCRKYRKRGLIAKVSSNLFGASGSVDLT
jgi:hypothetical protein